MTVTGTIVREDLGPGEFLLVTSDGHRYALRGGDDALRSPGLTVKVEGQLVEAMGIGMTGNPTLEVARYTPA